MKKVAKKAPKLHILKNCHVLLTKTGKTGTVTWRGQVIGHYQNRGWLNPKTLKPTKPVPDFGRPQALVFSKRQRPSK
jgi:hypothetical protein